MDQLLSTRIFGDVDFWLNFFEWDLALLEYIILESGNQAELFQLMRLDTFWCLDARA